jgi:hypothetical protein
LYLNAAYQLGGDGIQDDALLKLCELRSASGDLDGSESLLNRIMPTAGTILKARHLLKAVSLHPNPSPDAAVASPSTEHVQ